MKKRILQSTFFLLAIMAGITSVFGQAIHHSAPESPVSCTTDALHPIPGVPYDYSVTTDPAGGTFTWWATTNTDFITSGVLNNTGALTTPDVTPTTAGDYNMPTSSSSIQLTWSTDVLAAASGTSPTPTFVAVYYEAPAGSCADNLKVYQIEPVNAFIVDIKNLENKTLAPLAYSTSDSQCFDEVQSATWSSTGMQYDYGTNTLYFEVVAANFTEEWTPTFQITGLDAAQTASIEWDYDTTFGNAVSVTSGTTSSTAVATNVTDTSNGVSIFVKVTVDHDVFEGIADENITLAVTGTNKAGQSDVLATDCTTSAAFSDNEATQTLTRRPEVTPMAGGTFE